MRISVCLDRTQKQLNRLQNFFSLLTLPGHSCLSTARLSFTGVKSNNGFMVLENYLNSYFKNSYSRESNMAGFAVEHALTKHYHEGLKRGATRNTLVRLSCAV